MEYISAEEFLKQPKEVQEVLQNWFIDKFNNDDNNNFCIFNWNGENLCYNNILDRIYFKPNKMAKFSIEDCIPLLTESQLRKFIEDNTGGKIRIIEYDFDHYNIITWKEHFITKETNLLQAYWKVAIEIASEQIQ